MRILIIGGTGTIGQLLVTQALANGHEVTAFARHADGLQLQDRRLAKVAGDVMDPASLAATVPGHDVVIVAIGAGAKGDVRSQGTRNVVQAMQACGARRLICLSSLGVGDSAGTLNFFWKYVMFGLLLRRAFADHVRQEDYVKESGLDWTLVRPAAFTNGELTKEYRHGFPADTSDLQLKVSRADVVHFMLEQLASDRYRRQAPGISY